MKLLSFILGYVIIIIMLPNRKVMHGAPIALPEQVKGCRCLTVDPTVRLFDKWVCPSSSTESMTILALTCRRQH